MIKSIGGYPELELKKGEHYHQDAIKLNTARNCFEYILRVNQYKHVYIPYYTCEVMLEPIIKLGITYTYYHIDHLLEPVENYTLNPQDAFLYTNYFGLKQDCAERLAEQYGEQLIIDNAQAFFEKPIKGIDTIYSARKFFGVADGAYLYTRNIIDTDFKFDVSYHRMQHLLLRSDLGAEAGYAEFVKNENLLVGNPISLMSVLTEKLLCSIDYNKIKDVRCENYDFLDFSLKKTNNISLLRTSDSIPMVYPYLTNNINLRRILIDEHIYVAKYWPNVIDNNNYSYESFIANNLMPFPCSQSYNKKDLERIVNIIGRL